MNRLLLLLLTITSTVNSAAQMALGKPVYALIAGLLALLAFAGWVATAPDEQKKKVVDSD